MYRIIQFIQSGIKEMNCFFNKQMALIWLESNLPAGSFSGSGMANQGLKWEQSTSRMFGAPLRNGLFTESKKKK